MKLRLVTWGTRDGPEFQWQEVGRTDEFGSPVEISPIFGSKESAHWWLHEIVPLLPQAEWSQKVFDKNKSQRRKQDKLDRLLNKDVDQQLADALTNEILLQISKAYQDGVKTGRSGGF